MSQQLDRISEPLQRAGEALGRTVRDLGEALGRTVRDLGDFIRAMVEYVASICPPEQLKAAKEQAALKEAPPRIRHLAQHSKKRRTRKKNINRALREYYRRMKK